MIPKRAQKDTIARKAADILRPSTAFGPSGGTLKAEQFLNSLSEFEFQEVGHRSIGTSYTNESE